MHELSQQIPQITNPDAGMRVLDFYDPYWPRMANNHKHGMFSSRSKDHRNEEKIQSVAWH